MGITERLKVSLGIYLVWASTIYQISGDGGYNGGTRGYVRMYWGECRKDEV